MRFENTGFDSKGVFILDLADLFQSWIWYRLRLIAIDPRAVNVLRLEVSPTPRFAISSSSVRQFVLSFCGKIVILP